MTQASASSEVRPAVRRNLAANFSGQVWSALLGLAFVPVFLHMLGPEGYGLVGFATSLQAALTVLDLGLATTANREVARGVARGWAADESWALLRTLEYAYAAVGLLVFGGLAAAAPWLATDWLRADALPPDVVRRCLLFTALTVGIRWPVGLYTGVLRGLERQVPLTGVIIVSSTLRTAGAAAFLTVSGAGITGFFAWLAVAGVIELVAMATLAWWAQPGPRPVHARFDARLLGTLWRFAGQVGLISVFATILKQLDKVLVARFVSLEALGHYTVATTLSSGLLLIAAPVYTAVFPRLSFLLARGDERAAATLYHRACQFVVVLSAPAAAALIFFPELALATWTRSPAVAGGAATALSVLAVAMLLNLCMQLPYALQLAAGLTRIPLWTNGIAVVALVPLLIVLVRAHGIVGGAIAWAVFNGLYFLIVPLVMHRHVLRGQVGSWFGRDTLPFLALALVCYGAAAWIARESRHPAPVLLIAAATAVYGGIVLATWGRGAIKLRALTGILSTANHSN